jgi:3-hydroxyacyl-CoA dehydrogenase/enoyl-CoA hydratase/3-hydroxybutyryl-CoA epimerase
MPGGTPANPKIAGCCRVAPAALMQKTRGPLPRPRVRAGRHGRKARRSDFDTALRIESRYLAKLIVSPWRRNMINTFFFNMNAIRSGQSRPTWEGASSRRRSASSAPG